MDYFAGLDVSMEETHICVMDREGAIAHEMKVQTTPDAIAAELVKTFSMSAGGVRDRSNGADAGVVHG
jgi:hypothetical protein